MAVETPFPEILRFDTFEVDMRAGELRKQGVRIKVQEQPFHVLTVLLQRPGEVVTRDELRNQNWPPDIFVDFDNSLNSAINKLREALGDSADNPRFIETLPRRGYRFLVPVSSNHQEELFTRLTKWKFAAAVGLGALMVGAVGGWLLRGSQHAHRLTDKDTIVLADFTNRTGDAIFGETLKQGLRVQLEQSPFLNILSDQRMDEELKLMERSAGEQLTPELAQDLCQRVSGKAVLKGSISRLGTHYIIGLNAFNCHTGDELADEQGEAGSREDVLKVLSESATRMRKKLGESLESVQKYDVPLQQATTHSLVALEAYSLGMKTWWIKGETAAFPFFQRAVEMDPNFAMAYARMGVMHGNLWELGLSIENVRKAYELRKNTSVRERLYIESLYFGYVTGNLEKMVQALEVRAQIYPRDFGPHNNLANIYSELGKCDQGLEEAVKAMLLDQDYEDNYITLGDCYICLNRVNEAEKVFKQAEEHKLESEGLIAEHYLVAFLKGNEGEMRRLAEVSAAKPGSESRLVYRKELEETYHGRLRKAREILQLSMNSARYDDSLAMEATNQATLGLIEAYFGDAQLARADTNEAVKDAPNEPYVREIAALALALAGDAKRSAQLADELNKSLPLDTQWQRYLGPSSRAAIALVNDNADKALELLNMTSPYDMGTLGFMDPVYLRGLAHLALGNARSAATEFQKIIEHPGIVGDSPIGALAQLGMGRTYANQGDTSKARAAYQDFLALWRDADPDIPVLQQAKVEYAKLQ